MTSLITCPLNFLFSVWSHDGSITYSDTIATQQTCAFNHLTTFAVLFDFSKVMYRIKNAMFYGLMFFVISKTDNGLVHVKTN